MVIASLVLCNIGFAEITLIEEKLLRGKGEVYTVCVDGYKFVTFSDSDGTSMVQFYEWSPNYGSPMPTKC